jgi:uncharacterized cupin superfamily protein
MGARYPRIGRCLARLLWVGMICSLFLPRAAPRAETAVRDVVRLDRAVTPTEPGRYPDDMVVTTGRGGFDGSYTSATGYQSEDRMFTVALWQSGPGILKTDGYPHDEYCFVLEGRVVITNASGRREEFGPGDAFVIPKGWAGTWNMTTPFKKQYVAIADAPRVAR